MAPRRALLVGGIQAAIGSGQITRGAGGYLRAHRTECGSNSSTNDNNRTGENGLVR